MSAKEQNRLHVLNGVLERQWTVAEAAQLLGVSERHTWRVLAAYREEGAVALAHGNRGRSPPNTTPPGIRVEVIALAGDRYQGVNHTHFTELLAEREGIKLSRSTVRRLLSSAGLSSKRHRRAPCHRYRRQRMPQEGMLLQIDGSRHRWLGDEGPWLTLVLAVDDATGTVPYALFREQEDTEGYFRLMKGIIERRGIPLGLYSDRNFVFCYSKRAKEAGGPFVIDRNKPTQFGRAMRELGVMQVFARSPEAKGRIERANGTFQDRLVAELRLAGVRSLDEANGFLESFLPRFNERFGVPAVQREPAYRPLDQTPDIDGVLCFRERRRVAKDNTLQYCGHTLQIFPGEERRSYARLHVEVQERLDGRVLVCYQGKILTPQEAPPLAASLRAQAGAPPEAVSPAVPECPEPEEPPVRKRIWYEDSEMMRIHRDLIKAGMERARQQGKRIGRPRVTERPDFAQRFESAASRLVIGVLSRRRATMARHRSGSATGLGLEKIPLYFELTNLLIEFGDEPLVLVLVLITRDASGAIGQSLPPGTDLTGMQFKPAGELGDCFLILEGFRGYLRRERPTVLPTTLFHVLLLPSFTLVLGAEPALNNLSELPGPRHDIV